MQTKEAKRAAAEQRQAEAAKLTPEQRLARLDELFGPGLGATKERIKLHQRINQRTTTVKVHDANVVIAAPAEPGQSPRAGKRQRGGK